MRQILGLMVVAIMIITAGCGAPTYLVKSAMTTNVNICSQIKNNETTIFDIETEILKDTPTAVKREGDLEIRTYKSGYFTAKVTYKGNIVTSYECSKE